MVILFCKKKSCSRISKVTKVSQVMALEESCMACGLSCQLCGESFQVYEKFCSSCGASNKNAKQVHTINLTETDFDALPQCPDTAAFLRNLEALPKDERHACLMVTGTGRSVSSTLGVRSNQYGIFLNYCQHGGGSTQFTKLL